MAKLSDHVIEALKQGPATARQIAFRIAEKQRAEGYDVPEDGAKGFGSRSVSMACQRLAAHGAITINRYARTDGAIVYRMHKEAGHG